MSSLCFELLDTLTVFVEAIGVLRGLALNSV
jgi:hypothetical protein